ncbi:hypothetical protein RRG08_030055 [Elysia crispata]|uniref:Uncharacterized protein n=1 Tax=Elysia crispata TaxID=231223 RepID=A0AAE1CPB2_9GAST|nr:hypothetical protein RRG08_030055 [Elysia crispata]
MPRSTREQARSCVNGDTDVAEILKEFFIWSLSVRYSGLVSRSEESRRILVCTTSPGILGFISLHAYLWPQVVLMMWREKEEGGTGRKTVGKRKQPQTVATETTRGDYCQHQDIEDSAVCRARNNLRLWLQRQPAEIIVNTRTLRTVLYAELETTSDCGYRDNPRRLLSTPGH